jgi:serine phosphatase RsbU (regulator of sigma subunit)
MGDVLRRALLLSPPEALPVPELSVAVTYAAASAEQGPVGGDFFDAFALPGGDVALVVGDMAGKGLDAAVHIAAVRYALRAILREPASDDGGPRCPGAALARLNDFVCHSQELDGWAPEAFVRTALVILDTATGRGRFALAGAEAPLVLRGGGAAATAADAGVPLPHGPPLGAVGGAAYVAAPLLLPEGATLLLFTDGLTEARRPQRTPSGGIALLGHEGVARFAGVAASDAPGDPPGGPLPDMGRALLERVRGFAGGRLRDDVCLLLACRGENA